MEKEEVMDDLISRQAAIDALVGMDGKRDDDGYVMIYRCDACDNIYNLPSVQPEIIRCKECKHHDPEDKKCDSGHFIQWQLPRDDNWFCADAERRTDERSD